MMALALLIVLVSLPIFLFFLLQRYGTKRVGSPPGPPGLPLIGNLHQFDVSNTPKYLWKLSKQYGPLMSLKLGFTPILVVSSAKMAKEVFKTCDIQFSGRPRLLGQKTLSYNFIDLGFSPYNAYWREMRKICVVHLFNSVRAQLFRPIREDDVSRMIEKISESASASEPINLSKLMLSLTRSIIFRIAFGKRCEEDGEKRSRFNAQLEDTQTILGSFFIKDYFPFMGWVDKLAGRIRQLEKTFRDCDKFYQQLIDEHLDPKRPKSEMEDIIDVLLQIKKEREVKVDLTWDHIKAVLMNIFVGGTDTGAAAVVWAMANLMKNPTAMEKAQEEVRYIIGNKGFVDEDDLQRLPYLKAVVKETLRLHPPAPLLPRETTENCILNGYEIRSNTIAFVNVFAIGRDPEAWENPDEFDPDRFIGTYINFQGQNFELIPFGSGRRMCPGIHLGIATVELVIANLLYKFDWELPNGMDKKDLDFDVLPGLVMHKKNDLLLMPRKCI